MRVNTEVVYEAVSGISATINSQHRRAEVENSRASLAAHLTRMTLTTRWFVAMTLFLPVEALARLPVYFVLLNPLVNFFPDPRTMSVFPEAVIRAGQSLGVAPRGQVCRVSAPAGELEANDYHVARRPVVVVDADGRWRVKFDEVLNQVARERGQVFTHGGTYFSLQADGTTLPLFAAQTVPTGLHMLTMSHARIVEGAPVLTRTYRISAVRQRCWYSICFSSADSEWQQSILALQVLQSVTGKLIPWWGRDFQYALSHITTVTRYPDVSAQTLEYLDTTPLPELDTPVPVPASILQKIMPTLLGTTFEPDISTSVQALTVMQRAASEAKELGVPDRHIASVCAATYGIGVLEAERAKQQLQSSLQTAFQRGGLKMPK